jgi:periplasmic copper chaperone A
MAKTHSRLWIGLWRTLLFSVSVVFNAQAQVAAVSVTDSYVRETIPGVSITSAYMVIQNNSSAPIRLQGASSEISGRIEIHQHLMANGMMQMRQVDGITIDPYQQVELQPHGFHLMVFDVKQPLADGEQVNLTLQFAHHQALQIKMPVRSIKQQAHH